MEDSYLEDLETEHGERFHSEVSFSKLPRVVKCAASVQMSRQVVKAPEERSEAAKDGELRHECVQQLLLGASVNEFSYEVLQDAKRVVMLVGENTHNGPLYSEHIEERFYLPSPHDDVSGIADYVKVYQDGIVEVWDWKFGGKPVEARGNWQLLATAISVYYGVNLNLRTFILRIVQPSELQPVKEWIVSHKQLEDLAGSLNGYISAAYDRAPMPVSGEHCYFCPALGVCPEAALRNKTEMLTTNEAHLLSVDILSPAQVESIVLAAPMISRWLTEVKRQAVALKKANYTMPKTKLVYSRTHRKWINEAEVEAVLGEAAYEKKFKSPSTIEKELKGSPTLDELRSLWYSPPGALTIVPASDRRPEVRIGANMFSGDNNDELPNTGEQNHEEE